MSMLLIVIFCLLCSFSNWNVGCRISVLVRARSLSVVMEHTLTISYESRHLKVRVRHWAAKFLIHKFRGLSFLDRCLLSFPLCFLLDDLILLGPTRKNEYTGNYLGLKCTFIEVSFQVEIL